MLFRSSASAPSALHFSSVNDAVVPDTHATVSHDESMSDGPLSFRLFILLLICPYQLPPTPYSRQLLFMLTDYGVFLSVDYVFLCLGGKIIKWAASSCRAFNASDTWCFLIGSAPDESEKSSDS